MTFQKALLILLFIAALAGCAVEPTMKDTTQLQPGTGVMVARLAVPYLLQKGHLRTTLSVANLGDASDSGTPIVLSSAETFVVVPLSAGTYQWKDLHIGSYDSDLQPKTFDIVAGKINYVGDITLVMDQALAYKNGKPTYDVHFRVYDYHQYFLPKIAAAYPKLLGSYPVVVSLTSTPTWARASTCLYSSGCD
jgi:hypothetical protein